MNRTFSFILTVLALLQLTAKAQTTNRPQTPKPPFSYTIEEVEYNNADNSVHYGATLTIPANRKDFPTVIIISGSGTQDRNGTIFGHPLYWVLANQLTYNGIAVLRVDDRGAGKSTWGANPKSLTSADFSYDVETSLNYLLQRKDINPKNIGLIGHSEGGIIAPMVAARRKEIAFLVLWGAPAIGGAATNVSQNMIQLQKARIDSGSTAAFGQLHSAVLSHFTDANKELLKVSIDTTYAQWKRVQPDKVIKGLYCTDSLIVGQNIHKMYNSLYDMTWMRYFINYDPVIDLKQVKCRVLAINGEKDTQVEADANLALIEKTFQESHNKKATIKKLAGLNHLLQTAITGDFTEYQKIEETIDPAAMEIISSWINKK
jgi:pimeloyl-ACP methyl ester carboxylesterase